MRSQVFLDAWRMGKYLTALSLFLIALCLAAGPAALAADKGFETPPTLEASKVLPVDLLQGKRFVVEEKVPTDGFLMRFTIRSDFGTFIASSPEMAKTRITEIDALDRLEQVSKSGAFIGGLKASGREFGQQVGQLIINPVETVTGLPEGVGRFFSRVGRGARTGQQRLGDVREQQRQTAPPPPGRGAGLPGDPAPTATKGEGLSVPEAAVRAVGRTTVNVFGYDDQRRRIARELQVDPYSTNPVLTERLDEIASAAFAGGLGITAFKAVVPLGMVVSTTTMLSDWVWDMPPGDLIVQNERILLAMGVSQEQVDLLLRHPYFTLTLKTRLVIALERLKKTAGRSWIMPVAITVTSFDQARFIVEAMEMLAGYHEETAPLKSLKKEAPFGGITESGALLVAGPVDLLSWNERLHRFATRSELKGNQRILLLRGEATPRAKQELFRLGWTVREQTTKKQ
jgi:hypothetical protein